MKYFYNYLRCRLFACANYRCFILLLKNPITAQIGSKTNDPLSI